MRILEFRSDFGAMEVSVEDRLTLLHSKKLVLWVLWQQGPQE